MKTVFEKEILVTEKQEKTNIAVPQNRWLCIFLMRRKN